MLAKKFTGVGNHHDLMKHDILHLNCADLGKNDVVMVTGDGPDDDGYVQVIQFNLSYAYVV